VTIEKLARGDRRRHGRMLPHLAGKARRAWQLSARSREAMGAGSSRHGAIACTFLTRPRVSLSVMRIALIAILAVGCSAPVHEPAPNKPLRPRIVAHRGASYEAPENTLAAFKRAWALGVEAVELDVRV